MRKKKLNGRLAAILDLISAKFVTGYPCVRHYIFFYIHGPAILHFFSITVEFRYNALVGVQKTGPPYKWIAL